MAQDTTLYERIARNETNIENLKEQINTLKNDFNHYKDKIEENKKHQENMMLLKIGLIVSIISILLTVIVNLFFKK